ncbi:hypothetical protein QBC33DRAFT_555416 [Phialemonium atrogriseum]|uniref:Uncharacterized protein n=1 Tax=Phialemonium atrogriseum TaxID=1093897 RepID=A0AAJ0C678_9PEZI|nr:uncharacterized protein QBC33DRAFT_555416 [Phialemonium atrogriseum]KAK1770919.1 hypothetical protein QBC33DRAFT_555416 [Phialemonium atrogriseum]
MASLPNLHPALTLHLFDRALTPIISSADVSEPGSTRSAAVASLSRSALAAYGSAQRLEMGSPVRIMVECEFPPGDDGGGRAGAGAGGKGGVGPVVLSSFVEPAGEGGTRVATSSGRRRTATRTNTTTTTAGSAGGPDSDPDDADNRKLSPNSHRPPPTSPSPSPSPTPSPPQHGPGPGSGNPANAAPVLFGIVVAPDAAEHGGEARRAAGRLERVARGFQAAWAEEQAGGGGG